MALQEPFVEHASLPGGGASQHASQSNVWPKDGYPFGQVPVLPQWSPPIAPHDGPGPTATQHSPQSAEGPVGSKPRAQPAPPCGHCHSHPCARCAQVSVAVLQQVANPQSAVCPSTAEPEHVPQVPPSAWHVLLQVLFGSHGRFRPLQVVNVLSSGSIHGVSQGRSELQMAPHCCVPSHTAGGTPVTQNVHPAQALALEPYG